MPGQPRLTTAREKKGRGVVHGLILLLLLVGGGWLLEQRFGLVTQLREGVADAKKGLVARNQPRGAIFDRNLKQLAVNMPQVSVYLRSREIESIPHTLVELAGIIPLERQRVQEQLGRGELRLWVARGISDEQETAIKALNLPGVHLEREEKRYYPGESQAAHLLGYAEDGIGLAGVELYYDRLLADRKLRQQGRQSFGQAPDLVLTLDMKIQTVLEQLLEEAAALPGVEQAAAYLLEGKSGEVLAGVQLPSFNPNTFAAYRQEQRENLFLVPMLLPDRFRLLIRDAATLIAQASKAQGVGAWSLNPDGEELGSGLRLWEWLDLGEYPVPDFHPVAPPSPLAATARPVRPLAGQPFGLIPDTTTPLGPSLRPGGAFR
jgi:cell division protein FtsI (penicillin-binding protein 3)